jgi:hypothetical protein
MSRIFVHGSGAVSPAGWGLAALRSRLENADPLPVTDVAPPGLPYPLRSRKVPPPATRPSFLAHPRLRRCSPIAQYTVAAALEALGADFEAVKGGTLRLGIVFCCMTGCVIYSRRFFDEVLKEPATASPLLFPETVFNAPASHLGALLGTDCINYTVVGDGGTFLQGLAIAADWLRFRRVDACLIIAAEELDWIIADSLHHFGRDAVLGEGAGALYLKATPPSIPFAELRSITDSHLFLGHQSRAAAARQARTDLGPLATGYLLCDGLQGSRRQDRDELAAWRDWTGVRWSPKRVCGEAFSAAAAWQSVLACDALSRQHYPGAYVSVVGANEMAI